MSVSLSGLVRATLCTISVVQEVLRCAQLTCIVHHGLKFLCHVACVSIKVVFAGDPTSLAHGNIISEYSFQWHTAVRQLSMTMVMSGVDA